MNNFVEQSVQLIREQTDFCPEIAIVCGSGLGKIAELITESVNISFDDLPGFPNCTVDGHAGQLVLGMLGGKKVVCMQGRCHFYEGGAVEKMTTPLRVLRALGCSRVLLTNSAGSLDANNMPGALVLVSDHINFQFNHPLVGPNDDRFGPRFVAMDDAYSQDMRADIQSAAAQLGFDKLPEGIYLGVMGPTFETPAEIKAFKMWGADLVGMSTVADVIVAKHCGLEVATISVVTNLASGMHDKPLSHAETLSSANAASDKLIKLIEQYLTNL